MIGMNSLSYDGYLDYKNLNHVEIEENNFNKYKLENGDILFNRTNSKELVGKTAIFDNSNPMVYASYLIRLRVDKKKANPFYLWGFLNSKYGKALLFETSRQAVSQPNINAQELKRMSLQLPPIYQQNKFEQIIKHQTKLYKKQIQAENKINLVFDSLMQKAFNDELS